MIDFINYFRAASAIKENWSESCFLSCVNILLECHDDLKFDWQKGDEVWGRIFDCNGNYAYLHAEFPLLVGNDFLFQSLDRISEVYTVIFVLDRNLDIQKYKLDLEQFEYFSSRKLPKNEDYNSLSFNDIWWFNP